MNIASVIDLWKLGYPVKKTIDPLYCKLVNTDADCFTQDDHLPSPIFACHFCRKPSSSHILVNTNESGEVYIIDTIRRTKNVVTSLHTNAVFDFSWLAYETAIITGSGDHSAKVWDLESGETLAIARGHERSIKCVSSKLSDPYVFATGGRDGYILQFDLRDNNEASSIIKPDQAMIHPHPGENCSSKRKKILKTDFSSSITGLVYQDDHTLLSCSALGGLIKVWDMRKTYTVNKMLQTPKAILKHPKWESQSFTNLVVSPCQTKVYANGLDGNNYCFNVGVYSEFPIATYKGPPKCTFYTKNSISPDGRYLSVGSVLSSAYVWNVDNSLPLIKLEGHDLEVTGVDWRPSTEPVLATCSDDATCRVWRVEPRKHPDVAGENCSDQNLRIKGHAVKQNNDQICKEKRKFYSCHLKEFKAALKKTMENDENKDLSNIPHHLQTTPAKSNQSLTSQLPNLVIDGVSPHHHICTRPSSAVKYSDWLTKLRQSSTPPPITKPSTRSNSAVKGERSSSRKPSRSLNMSKRKRTARSNLMEYFRVAATLRDTQCSPAAIEERRSNSPLPPECL